MTHLWIVIPFASIFGWSALACMTAGSTGPSVTIRQCARCSTTRVATEEDQVRYVKLGCVLNHEPEVCQR